MSLILSGTNGLSDVDGTAATPAIRGTDANTGIFFPAADQLAASVNGIEGLRLTSTGLGIGTSSPSVPFEVQTASGSSYTVNLVGRSSDNASTVNFWNSGKSARNFIYSDPTTGMQFGTSGSERARIDSSGNLLVGKTSSDPTTGAGTLIGPSGAIYATQTASTNSNYTYHVYSTGAGTYRFYVGMGGTVYATSTTISAISDQRLKENVQDLDVGLDAVMALKPRKFDWKAGKGKDTKGDRGFIAQEFEQVFPDLIDTWKDPAPEGEEPYKSVRADLIPVLVKSIQEQQAMIAQLQADIASLKGTA